jgi:hypothetical protein
MQCLERTVAGALETFALGATQPIREGHEALGVERVPSPGCLDRELRVELHRAREIRPGSLQQRRDPLEPRRGGEGSRATGRVLLLKQTEDSVGALVHVYLRVGLLLLEVTAEEVGRRKLRLEEDLVDSIVLAPSIGRQRPHGREQTDDVLTALHDRAHRVVRETAVEPVITIEAGEDWTRVVPPSVVVVRELAEIVRLCRERVERGRSGDEDERDPTAGCHGHRFSPLTSRRRPTLPAPRVECTIRARRRQRAVRNSSTSRLNRSGSSRNGRWLLRSKMTSRDPGIALWIFQAVTGATFMS